MDRLEHYVEEVLCLAREVEADREDAGASGANATPAVEVRNTPGGSGGHEADGEELVSLISHVLAYGLHPGLSVWDVLEQTERLPETAHVYLAPAASVTSSSNVNRAITDTDDLAECSLLDRVLSSIAPRHETVDGDDDANGNASSHVGGAAAVVRHQHEIHPADRDDGEEILAHGHAGRARPRVPALRAQHALADRGDRGAVLAAQDRAHVLRGVLRVRNPEFVKALLDVVAPIGGPSLRVRAAAALFQMSTSALTKPGLDFDRVNTHIEASGAALAAEKASRNVEPEAEEGVALLCATVSEARDVLRHYPVTPAYITVSLLNFCLDLSLKTDEIRRSVSPRATIASAEHDPATEQHLQRRRAATVMGASPQHTGQPDPDNATTDDSSVIVVQRRRRAPTMKGGAAGPKRPKPRSRVVTIDPNDEQPQPATVVNSAVSLASPTTASSPLMPQQPAASTTDAAAPLARTSPVRRQRSATTLSPKQSPKPRRPGAPATAGSPHRRTRSDNMSTRATADSSCSTPRALSDDGTAAASQSMARPFTALRVADVVAFEDEETAALEAVRDSAAELDDRIAAVRSYVAGASARVERHHADAEPVLAAYEDAIEFLFAQAMARVQAKERELMSLHDYDCPPAPEPVQEDAAAAPVVAPPTAPPKSRIGAYA
eukprot:CAMPEP_0174828402 /NCGR_PEP_ID=MMETSP1114-20130205/1305_1 /TAXON_ID=312471 /ORGANISM="Neobodo designis, Strain CCAP 1951/1" /LENGTH=664 /DNA_ID=CAMNT_0016062115 /DNA_START=89 /DNA_END=2083 /DNA_ORIENTATION=+